MKYSQITLDYCSCKCSNSSKEVREKVKQTCLERFGCEYASQNKDIQEKAKQTCLERFGCEYASQNKEIQEKVKRTCIERYGAEHPAQSKEVQEKAKQTCIERYNVEHPLKSREIQNKIKQSNLERYNVENIFQSEEFQKKFKQTCLERYGCEHPMQSEKVKQKLHDKSFDNFILSFIKYNIVPLFSKEEYTGWDKTYRWKCLICGTEFEQKIHTTGHVKECPYLPHCWKCYPRMSGESRFELEVFNFINELAPNVRQHDRTIIRPQELDIVIDELKLAIEFNGDYWHSVEVYLEHHDNLDEYYNYHLNKILEANKKGYRLIHIGESEWINNKEEINGKIKNIFQGKENLNFTGDTIKLDRSWYNNVEIPGYELVGELPPEIVKRDKFDVENCGYLIYERINQTIF